jgi:sigma-B regulation protein RsbU (phosphoserine phosphatase)
MFEKLMEQKIINKPYLITSVILFVFTRLVGDVILSVFDKYVTDNLYIWNTLTGILITGAIVWMLFYDILYSKFAKSVDLTQLYFSELTRLVYIMIGITVLSAFLPNPKYLLIYDIKLINILIIDAVSILLIYAGGLSLLFFYKWTILRKMKKTKLYLIILVISYLLLVLVYLLRSFIDLQPLNYILITIIGVFAFLATSRNAWIAELPKSKKYLLLLLTATISSLCFIIFGFVIRDGSSMLNTLNFFMDGTNVFVEIPVFILLIHSSRIFFSTVGSIPTSHIVERRNYEIKSLTYLNQIIAQTVDLENLIDTVTRLAFNASNATAAWTTLNINNKTSVLTNGSKEENQIIKMLDNEEVRKQLINIQQPVFIDSLEEYSEPILYEITSRIDFANSMISIPLYAGDEKIGNMTVLHSDEYGFDQEDVNVLKAFSDNVNIAIENARLLQESFEKERYKSELMIARDMEQKLLPHELPVIKNYKLHAFTVPATEVGGDYYDLVFLKNGKPCVLVGDVSGKGMSAAFYMAQLKGVVLAVSREAISPKDILIRINDTLFSKMDRQVFITITALTIDDDEGQITFARAGHMPIMTQDGQNIGMHIPSGIGVGLTNGGKFSDNIEEKTVILPQKWQMYLDH